MLYKNAKKLHNNDEITLKQTGETTNVISTKILEKNVFVYAMTHNGYSKLNHKEFK